VRRVVCQLGDFVLQLLIEHSAVFLVGNPHHPKFALLSSSATRSFERSKTKWLWISKGQTVSDAETTLQDLRAEIYQFNDDRDWHQFHTPKNLAASIAIEAAELLEHFQWSDEPAPNQLPQLLEELADVMIYCLTLSKANRLFV
jgi:NTP pyrophosphatase (non-canonical NTP hydrolase)